MVEGDPPFPDDRGGGIVVMVADNDAAGITTYKATGARMLMETNPYTGTFEVQALSMPSLASPSALCRQGCDLDQHTLAANSLSNSYLPRPEGDRHG